MRRNILIISEDKSHMTYIIYVHVLVHVLRDHSGCGQSYFYEVVHIQWEMVGKQNYCDTCKSLKYSNQRRMLVVTCSKVGNQDTIVCKFLGHAHFSLKHDAFLHEFHVPENLGRSNDGMINRVQHCSFLSFSSRDGS